MQYLITGAAGFIGSHLCHKLAKEGNKIIAVDRMIIETALTTIKERNMQDQYFGINLSPRTVHDDQFVIWLERRLLKDANIAFASLFWSLSTSDIHFILAMALNTPCWVSSVA